MIQSLSLEINLFIWNTSDLRSISETDQDPVGPLGMKAFQIVANQGRKGMQGQIVQPWGRVLIPSQGISAALLQK